MKIKELFTKSRLKPHMTFSQKGNINRLFLSGNDILVCETRDLQDKEVFFFSLNYVTKEIYLKDFQLDEKWWISIDSLNNDTIYLHTFKRPDMPEPVGIKAVDIRRGSLKWDNMDLIFYFCSDENVYAYKQLFEKRIYYRLNASTGDVEEEYAGDSSAFSLSVLKERQEAGQFRNFRNTEVFSPQSALGGADVSEYLSYRFNKIDTLGDIEYIRFCDYLIYNFHISGGINIKNISETYYSNRLEIYNLETKSITYEDTLNDKVLAYVPDSFFMKGNVLFYIREKKELVIINLN
jgi:hypothetical protein